MVNKIVISLFVASSIMMANNEVVCKPIDNKNIKKLYQNIDSNKSKVTKTNLLKTSNNNNISKVEKQNINSVSYNNEIIELRKELNELKNMNRELFNRINLKEYNKLSNNNEESNQKNMIAPYTSLSLKETSDKMENYKKENNIVSNYESLNNSKISFNNKNQDDVLEYLVNNLNKINQKIDSIQNNVIEYKYKGDFDPSEYSKYNVTSKMLVEVDKGGKIINVYTKGTELIGKKDGKTLIVGSDGYVDISGVEKIKD